MLAASVDLLQAANWQRGGNKSAPRPKPWPRPGQTAPGQRRFGNRKMTVAEYEQHKQARRLRRQARHVEGGEQPSPSNSPPATSP
jgi:hypothetical protein